MAKITKRKKKSKAKINSKTTFMFRTSLKIKCFYFHWIFSAIFYIFALVNFRIKKNTNTHIHLLSFHVASIKENLIFFLLTFKNRKNRLLTSKNILILLKKKKLWFGFFPFFLISTWVKFNLKNGIAYINLLFVSLVKLIVIVLLCFYFLYGIKI